MWRSGYLVSSGSGRGLARHSFRLVAGLLAGLAASACGDGGQWRTTALDSDFPPLEFRLTGEAGETITEQRLRGDVTLLFFGYTHCPDVCPSTLSRLRGAIHSLPEAQRERVSVLFVSVDPARDDPEQLAAYTNAFGPEFIGATADESRLKEVTSRYGSAFSSRSDGRASDNYAVLHGSSVFVFDGQGRARLMIDPDDGVDAISHDLRRLLS